MSRRTPANQPLPDVGHYAQPDGGDGSDRARWHAEPGQDIGDEGGGPVFDAELAVQQAEIDVLAVYLDVDASTPDRFDPKRSTPDGG